jgi:hypothetical protein
MRAASRFAFVGLGVPSIARAQRSTLVGTVADAVAKRPVINAEVILSDGRLRVKTDSTGTYRIDGLAHGTFIVIVARSAMTACPRASRSPTTMRRFRIFR